MEFFRGCKVISTDQNLKKFFWNKLFLATPLRRQKNFGQCTILGVQKFFRTYQDECCDECRDQCRDSFTSVTYVSYDYVSVTECIKRDFFKKEGTYICLYDLCII